MALKTRQLQTNFGTEVLDVDLASLDDACFDAVRAAWQLDPVVLIEFSA